MKDRKPYRIAGAYDSETTNYTEDGRNIAFPILHQLGIIKGDVFDITPENVESEVGIELFRHSLDLFRALDDLICTDLDYIPVILCHNLSFDMYGLSPWLARHNVRVLAKSARKPITFTVRDENDAPRLVIWDTLVFSGQSLERMGKDCGYSKGTGEWDYDAIRTPETPLTPDEIDYAKRDIYALLCWFSWWIKRNPDINPEKLGLNVVTKTGIVRERRRVRFDRVRGQGMKYNIGRFWLWRNRMETPKTDDELFTMTAATRGGFTFCSSVNASVPFDLVDTEYTVSAYDATSQHPAQMVSHMYPVGFKEHGREVLELAFDLITKITLEDVLNRWNKPFPVAFYACYEFENLRPKEGSVFERYGIMPLASARYKGKDDEDQGDRFAYEEYAESREYCDRAEGAVCAFGKLVSADRARLYITELTAWEISQCYEWDSVKAIHGYSTGRFVRPSDMDTVSVMQFYKAKDAYKSARETYYSEQTITNGSDLLSLGIAPAIVNDMQNGTLTDSDVEATYLSLKADLNSLFGINASNEFRRDTVLGDAGIEYVGSFGVENAPKNPKVWYQFGQRIVGWSRIAQICACLLIAPHVETIVNGDTDSIKAVVRKTDKGKIDAAFSRLSAAIDSGKAKVCSRVKRAYPTMYDALDGIGHYVHEFDSERFCASWNKAYCTHDVDKREGMRRFSFTLAGVPTRRRTGPDSSFVGVNGIADMLYGSGMTFAEITDVFLGYNVTYAHDVIRLNARTFPQWASSVFLRVCDRDGNTSTVAEPSALALYPMSKTVNDTHFADNAANMEHAIRNRPTVNTDRRMIYAGGILEITYGG